MLIIVLLVLFGLVCCLVRHGRLLFLKLFVCGAMFGVVLVWVFWFDCIVALWLICCDLRCLVYLAGWLDCCCLATCLLLDFCFVPFVWLLDGWFALLRCDLIGCLGCLCSCCLFWFDCLIIISCLVNYLLIVCSLNGLFDCLLFSLLLLFSLFSSDCYLRCGDCLLLRWWFVLVGVCLFLFVFIGCWFDGWL